MFSIFNKWNPKKPPKLKVPISLAPFKWDMHSHLLPGIDDGAQNIEQSIELIEKLIAFGYEGAVTTPHVYWDMY
ncbi:MAG: CpsB/CapC family capsule biosynthesis tyrosine phosphatase, partial [Flavobacteriales bacterium]